MTDVYVARKIISEYNLFRRALLINSFPVDYDFGKPKFR